MLNPDERRSIWMELAGGVRGLENSKIDLVGMQNRVFKEFTSEEIDKGIECAKKIVELGQKLERVCTRWREEHLLVDH